MALSLSLGLSLSRRGAAASTEFVTATISPFAWFATSTAALSGDFDPNGSPETMTVTRSGYSTDGTPATVTDTVVKLKRIRMPYPNEATLTAANYALSDVIFADDVVAGAVNNSTEPYPLPICKWMTPEWTVSATTLQLDMFVAHWFARNGAPVARVEFKVTDGTTTVTVVASLTSAAGALTGITVPRYRATVNLAASGLTQGVVTAWAVVYPWVGEIFDISTQGHTYPNTTYISVQKHIYGAIAHWAYVDTGAGGGGTVQSTLAGAQGTPYATFDAAKTALVTAKGNLSKTCIVLKASQTFTYARFDNAALGSEPFYILGEGSGATRPILYPTSASGVDKTADLLRIDNVRLRQNAANSIFFGNRIADETGTTIMVDCTMERNSLTAGQPIKDIGRLQMVRVENVGYAEGGLAFMSTSAGFHPTEQIDCINIAGQATQSMIGCDNSWTADGTDGGMYQPLTGAHIGAGMAYCKIATSHGVNSCKLDGHRSGVEGFFLVGNQCVLGGTVASGAANDTVDADDCLEFYGAAPTVADSTGQIKNVIVQHNTFAGGDANGPRDSKAGTTIEMYWSVKWIGNIAYRRTMAADVGGASGYSSDGSRTRNWAQRFQVNARWNIYYGTGATFGSGEFVSAETAGLGNAYGTTAWPGFAHDASFTGDNDHATPDYRLVNDAAGANKIALVPRLAAKDVAYPVDLFGTAIPTNGTALPGARQALA